MLPAIPKGQLRGTRDVVVDHADKVWFPIRTPGNETKMSRYDPVTNTLDIVEGSGGQFVGIGGDGFVWAGATRIDPNTNELVEYQWPTEFDTKKIAMDPTTSNTVIWMANKRTARISKVEPLD